MSTLREAAIGAMGALETARNGLAWYRDRYPESTDGSDDEAAGDIDAAIDALRAELAKPDARPAPAEPQPIAAWSIVRTAESAVVTAVRAALSAPAEQDGWQLVPVGLTEAMHVAGVRTIVHCTGNDDWPPRVWHAMLADAPRPAPAEPQPERDFAAEVDHWMKRSKEWRKRAEAAESAVSEFHHAIKDAGWHPGRTDDSLPDIIRAKGAELRAAPAPQPAGGEPVAALIRHRSLRTEARIAHDRCDHYSDWSDWEPSTVDHALAVTDPARNTNPHLWEARLLVDCQPQPAAQQEPT